LSLDLRGLESATVLQSLPWDEVDIRVIGLRNDDQLGEAESVLHRFLFFKGYNVEERSEMMETTIFVKNDSFRFL
jgi:hypothetical protein